MDNKEVSKQTGENINNEGYKSNVEFFKIAVKAPSNIEPCSKLEVRYLNFLIKKHSKFIDNPSILIEKK